MSKKSQFDALQKIRTELNGIEDQLKNLFREVGPESRATISAAITAGVAFRDCLWAVDKAIETEAEG